MLMLDPDPTDATRAQRILLLDTDEAGRRELQLLLHGRGFEVRAFASAAPLLHDGSPGPADILLTAEVLRDADGIAVVDALRRRGWRGRAVLITALRSPALTARARASGFAAVLDVPFHHHDLLAALRASPATP
ncbi:response regulator [Sphingomonas sp. RB3P16]|uniref:response regulator n=1 Tax=Parasphingomonas frigoris TaxID=3096163 RepID=UPI002FCB7F68